MHRRAFLTALGVGVLSSLAGCTGTPKGEHSADGAAAGGGAAPVGQLTAVNAQSTLRLPPQTEGASTPPDWQASPVPATPTTIDRLDGHARRLALTVDDGTSTEVLSAYVDFAIASGIRMTFFPNGVYSSWSAVSARLAPLVESGQVQLGNHTWDHPSITALSHREIVDQLTRNEKFLNNTYGVSGRPYFRPPFGDHNSVTDAITGDLGFTRTVMWWGSLGDSAILTSDQVLAQARQWFQSERIVIGHANHPAITTLYGQLVELIRERNLQTVTLRDAFGDLPLSAALPSS